jgi:YVTN family beta-propeller protein
MKKIFALMILALMLASRSEAALTLITTIAVGSDPQGIAINPTTGLMYVANEGGTTVSVIDISTDAVTATITGFSGPRSIVIDTSANILYVTNYTGAKVSVVDGATNTITTTVTVGTNPVGLAFDASDAKLFVANYGSSSVSVINTSTNTLSATISTFADPYEVLFNESLGVVYVSQASSSASHVDVIDASTNAVSTTITTSYGFLEGMSFNSATDRLYVSATLAGYLVVINTSSNAIVTSFSVTTASNNGQNIGSAVNGPANLVYTCNRTALTISTVDGLRNTLLSTLSRAGAPFLAVYYPTNDRLYVTLSTGNAVAVYSAGTPTYASQDNGVFETY